MQLKTNLTLQRDFNYFITLMIIGVITDFFPRSNNYEYNIYNMCAVYAGLKVEKNSRGD